MDIIVVNRRRFLAGSAFAAAAMTTPGLFAEELSKTPRQTEGPFYPDKLPLDTDNDLLILNDATTPAVGEVTHMTGRVLSTAGEPIRNAVVEIWQADANGVYIHSQGGDKSKDDTNFQGFGRFMTGLKGEYYFRTIKPVPYGNRPPHIHVAVYTRGKRMLTTQCYIDGHEMNARDGIVRGTKGNLEALMVDFKPMKGSKIGELTANFEIVLGQTPEDPDNFQKQRQNS